MVQYQRLGGDGHVVADFAASEDCTARPQGYMPPQAGVDIVIAADAAALIDHEVVLVVAPTKDRTQGVDQQENRRQFDFVENIAAVHHLVEQEYFLAPACRSAVPIKLIGEDIQPCGVLIAMRVIENRLLSIKEVLIVDGAETMLKTGLRLGQRGQYLVEANRDAVREGGIRLAH